MGEDVGYGFGWRFTPGSLQTYRRDFWTVDHYLFTDGTGAEYRLDTVANGVWTASKDPTYVAYHENTNRLYFTVSFR